MRRLAMASALLLGLAGCSLTLDPDSVPKPGTSGCVPVCNASLICGVTPNTCGTTCAVGSGCTPVAGAHTLRGRLTPGAGSVAVAGGHSISQGTLAGGEPRQAAATGHSISQGTLTP
jgi:hypothetical protein